MSEWNTWLQHLNILSHYLHPLKLWAPEETLGIFIYNKLFHSTKAHWTANRQLAHLPKEKKGKGEGEGELRVSIHSLVVYPHDSSNVE